MNEPVSELLIEVEEIKSQPQKNTSSEIVVDFSMLRRFDDEFKIYPNTVFVRTHYFDFYRRLKQKPGSSDPSFELADYDYFEMSCTQPIKYILDLSPDSAHRASLKYFLENIFLPLADNADFREGQVGIIGSALAQKGTVGLLPTGSGKSICYQLSAILQPAISFVVCPIKSLMYDQKADLDTIGITRTNYITSDQKSHEKSLIQNEFGEGKYLFVFVSPERFQTQVFRSEMAAIGLDKAFAYAVIDEAHCLSEWGHDFRTSYLNLANTIENLAPEASYIGLTATASVNVLKDIQAEFKILDENVRAPLDFTRNELNFDVIDDKGKKKNELVSLAAKLDQKWNDGPDNNNDKKAGIVFTSTVDGANGCFALAGFLATSLSIDVRYFSGKNPKKSGLKDEKFSLYKQDVQLDFKSNKYRLLTATKAFGMGVNKGNIGYTIHYGIPGSMEALYQEAGRAGRDKTLFQDQPADCYVILTKEKNAMALDQIWDATSDVARLKDLQKELSGASDVSTNLFLMNLSQDTINIQFKLMWQVYSKLVEDPDVSLKVIQASDFGTNKAKLEKVVHRLSQVGIVSDWMIENFFTGKLEVTINHLNEEDIGIHLEKTISKYDSEFSINQVHESKSEFYQEICKRLNNYQITQTQFNFLILLIWSHDHFAYNRRQSLKTVYEHCGELASGAISHAVFKDRLEAYFKFNASTHFLHYLAENSAGVERWLEVFFEDGSKVLLGETKLAILKEQLARFLESYKDNICLDYLSGIMRLISDQFNDTDGERRMISSLDKIRRFSPVQIENLLRDTIELAPLLSEESQNQFSSLFFKNFPDPKHLNILNQGFGDAYSSRKLLGPLNNRLNKVVSQIREIDW